MTDDRCIKAHPWDAFNGCNLYRAHAPLLPCCEAMCARMQLELWANRQKEMNHLVGAPAYQAHYPWQCSRCGLGFWYKSDYEGHIDDGCV